MGPPSRSRTSGAKVVGFESINTLTNLSSSGWSKSTGLLSLWILGQFNATPSARIVLPIREGSTSKLGVPSPLTISEQCRQIALR